MYVFGQNLLPFSFYFFTVQCTIISSTIFLLLPRPLITLKKKVIFGINFIQKFIPVLYLLYLSELKLMHFKLKKQIFGSEIGFCA